MRIQFAAAVYKYTMCKAMHNACNHELAVGYFVVGKSLGAGVVGNGVGLFVGHSLGLAVGLPVGSSVGQNVG